QSRGNATDIDGTVDTFVVTEIISGSLRIGTNSSTALPWDGSNCIIDTTHYAYWIPDTDANGLISAFSLVARDNLEMVSSSPVVFQVQIQANNDTPVANDQSISPIEDTTYTGTLGGSDVDNTTLTYTIGILPTKGVVTITNVNTGAFTYVPNLNATGVDSFTFKVNDGTVDSAPATISVNISAVNDTPVANAQSISPTEDTIFTGTLTGSDVESSALTYSIVIQPTKGLLILNNPVTGEFTYLPDLNANGADNFTFTVSDGSVNSAEATVSIQITPVNDSPMMASLGFAGIEDTTIFLNFANFANSFTDPENAPLASITIISLPSTGTLKLSGNAVNINQVVSADDINNLAYYPLLNDNGTRYFTFTASDGALSSEITTVSLVIISSNDTPTLQIPAAITITDTSATDSFAVSNGSLVGADVDSNTTLTYSITGGTVAGTVVTKVGTYGT
ncbi:MAG: tandem-95 repeat protein, partial [Planctomycetes bacterium]|nr:tandem-95 repeat protein [Planctomycetota bacterium]